MMSLITKTNLTRAFLVSILAALGIAGSSCDDEGGDLEPPDFIITVRLHTGFTPLAVDRLELILAPSTITLGESEGDAFDGGISWETSDDAGGEFIVNVTGEYFSEHAIEVSPESWEMDIPFNGSDGEAGFSVRATVYWQDPDGDEERIGYGTGILELPMERQGARTAVEVDCDTGKNWTCRTGCASDAQNCEEVRDCGSGFWECIDGCCIPE